MARAKRHYLPGHVWHITHRCHKKEFFLKLVKDRQRWFYWLFEAKKRYGFRILNYMATSNHIHLLVVDGGSRDTIPKSIQCIADIDLNMVRAGVVKHSNEWSHSGYNEIQKPKQRYGIIDFKSYMSLVQIETHDELKQSHQQWVEEVLKQSKIVRESKWTQSIAVGDKSFLEQIKERLGIRAKSRKIYECDDEYQLREGQTVYGDWPDSEHENTFAWIFSKL